MKTALKYGFFLIIGFLLSIAVVIAQETVQDTTLKPKLAKNTFYVEALGSAPLGTINYDRLFNIGTH
jgi:hypothetical protein